MIEISVAFFSYVFSEIIIPSIILTNIWIWPILKEWLLKPIGKEIVKRLAIDSIVDRILHTIRRIRSDVPSEPLREIVVLP